jgi:hypothetical protein
MKRGELIRTDNITKLLGIPPSIRNIRETWRCPKGYHCVVLILSTEENANCADMQLTFENFMRMAGWERKNAASPDSGRGKPGKSQEAPRVRRKAGELPPSR